VSPAQALPEKLTTKLGKRRGMDNGQARGEEQVLQDAVAVLERHIAQFRASDAGAAVNISWEEFLDVFGLDPNEPEHFRLIFEAAEARRDIIVIERGRSICFRQFVLPCR
jgi:hypothetical protein